MGGNIALAGDLFSENVRTNGVLVGAAGPKRRIQQRLAGFADLTTIIEDIFSAHERVVIRLVGVVPIPAHMGGVEVPASRPRSGTLRPGASKAARWRQSRRYRISSRF